VKTLTLDTLDRQLLQALQLDGRAPFSRIAAVLGVSDQTIARRYRKLCELGGLRVLGIVDEERLGLASWFVRLSCTPDAAEPLAAALARRDDTSWVGLASGGTEVVCTIRGRDRRHRDAPLLDRLNRTPRVVSVSGHLHLHTFYGGPLGWFSKSESLSADQADALRPPPVEPADGPIDLEPADQAILAVLRRDGRAGITELQAATHLSESAVRRRLDHLLRTGVVYIDVQFDVAPFGHDVRVLLWLTVAPAALSTVGHALAAHREVPFASAITGRSNLVAIALFREPVELYRYLSEQIGALDGVQHVETMPVLRQIKQLTYDYPR
jgi:DNA-binding Lrp family transcriptional regulator